MGGRWRAMRDLRLGAARTGSSGFSWGFLPRAAPPRFGRIHPCTQRYTARPPHRAPLSRARCDATGRHTTRRSNISGARPSRHVRVSPYQLLLIPFKKLHRGLGPRQFLVAHNADAVGGQAVGFEDAFPFALQVCHRLPRGQDFAELNFPSGTNTQYSGWRRAENDHLPHHADREVGKAALLCSKSISINERITISGLVYALNEIEISSTTSGLRCLKMLYLNPAFHLFLRAVPKTTVCETPYKLHR
jgi:hypothetical protein